VSVRPFVSSSAVGLGLAGAAGSYAMRIGMRGGWSLQKIHGPLVGDAATVRYRMFFNLERDPYENGVLALWSTAIVSQRFSKIVSMEENHGI
jgi:hypothetical protein